MPAGAPPASTPLAGALSSAAPPVTPVPNSDSQYDYYDEEYYDGETVTETSDQKNDLPAQFHPPPKTPK